MVSSTMDPVHRLHTDPPSSPPGVRLAHLVVSGSVVVLGLFFLRVGSSPQAELGSVLVNVGVVVVSVGLVLTALALVALVGSGWGGARLISLAFGVFEVLGGLVLMWAVAVALEGYGTFAPWRSPLLGPAIVLFVLGLTAVIRERRGRPGSR